MSSTIFYSENGELSLPEEPRRDGLKYKPVALGEPLCVEICRVALGNSDDWLGDNEILASSWAKTGGDAKPAPRVLNFYRDRLKPFESISNLGAEKFGHNLIFYSPAYCGETLRMTLEVLEVDQGGDEVVHFVKSVTGSLTSLPFFANQLPVLGALSLAPKVAEIGIGLYNLINKNDVLLKADLDLSFERPFQTPLNPGRYVFVYGSVAPAAFMRQYRLSPANTLVDAEGRDASRKGALEMPYAVIQITTDARKEYVKFQGIAQQQEYMGGIMSRLNNDHLQQIAGILNPISELATQGSLLGNILRLKKDLDEADEPALKGKLTKLLNGELTKLGAGDMQEVLRRAMGLDAAKKTVPAKKAAVPGPKKTSSSKSAGAAGRAGNGAGGAGGAGAGARKLQTSPARRARKTKLQQLNVALGAMSERFKFVELQAACPNVSGIWMRLCLNRLRKQGLLKCLGRGRYAEWARMRPEA